MRRLYGLTVAEYNDLLSRQGGGCAICGQQRRPRERLHVDHDHGTGEVRGILCTRCNTVLGRMEDSIDLLKAALTYLESR
jgi:Recombination endonuclease VII